MIKRIHIDVWVRAVAETGHEEVDQLASITRSNV